MSQELKIRSLNPYEIPDEAVCVFIGKRKSGKSFAIRDLMWHKRTIPLGHIVSGSEEANPFFSDFFPSTYIDGECSESTLNDIFKRQQKIKEIKKTQQKNGTKKVDSRFMIVLDDCLHDKKWQKTEEIRKVFMLGRHWDIFFILALQYVIGIPPNLRSNIDYVFIFRDFSISNRRKLYDNFGGCIPSFSLFCTLMDHLDKYEALVLCNDIDKVKFEDQVMYWKAQPRDFHFGSKMFWQKHNMLKQKQKYTVVAHQHNALPFVMPKSSRKPIKVLKTKMRRSKKNR